MNPTGRRKGIDVERGDGPIVLIDTERDVAFEVAPLTLWVWEQADGHRSVDDLVEEASVVFPELAVTREAVFASCDELADGELLVERITPPTGVTGISRRQALRRIGVGVAATAAFTATSVPAAAASEQNSKVNQEEKAKREAQRDEQKAKREAQKDEQKAKREAQKDEERAKRDEQKAKREARKDEEKAKRDEQKAKR